MQTETFAASSERTPVALEYITPINHQNHVKKEQPEDEDCPCKSPGPFTLQSNAL